MTMPTQTIMPKWIAFTPRLCAIGQSTGTSSTQIEMPSRKVPKISRIIATTRQNSHGARFIATIALTIWLEIPENVNSHENAEEVAIMNRTIALLLPESSMIR